MSLLGADLRTGEQMGSRAHPLLPGPGVPSLASVCRGSGVTAWLPRACRMPLAPRSRPF